jgi:hypothetical protein
MPVTCAHNKFTSRETLVSLAPDLLHPTEILDEIAVENQEIGFVTLLQLPDLSLTIARLEPVRLRRS